MKTIWNFFFTHHIFEIDYLSNFTVIGQNMFRMFKNYSFTLSYFSSILKCSSTKNLPYFIIPISPSFSFYHWFCCLRQYLVNANQTYYVKFKTKLIFICSPTSDNFQLEFLISHNYSTHFISNFFQCFWGAWIWWLLAFKLMIANKASFT